MQVALGRSASDEIRPGIFKVSKVVFSAAYNGYLILLLGLFLQSFTFLTYYVVGCCFSCFTVMLDFLLQICQRKRSKGNLFAGLEMYLFISWLCLLF